MPSASVVARSTSLPSSSSSRRMRSEIATRTASQQVRNAASGEFRSAAQLSAMAETRIATRSNCGAFTSMPSTAQKNATASAARTALLLLTGERTELREVVLQETDLTPVLGEVAGLERGLGRVVVVGG